MTAPLHPLPPELAAAEREGQDAVAQALEGSVVCLAETEDDLCDVPFGRIAAIAVRGFFFDLPRGTALHIPGSGPISWVDVARMVGAWSDAISPEVKSDD